MIFFKNVINMMFTDHYIRFALVEERTKTVKQVGEVKLKKGIISSGKIMDAELLQKIVRTIFKKYNLNAQLVNLMVPDATLVIKKIEVPSYLSNNDLKSHIKLELEEAQQILPYNDPIIDVFEYQDSPKENMKEVILFATSKQIISSYLKVIQRFKKTVTKSFVSPLLTRKLFLYSKNQSQDGQQYTMYTQIRENSHIITIFDHHLPIISLKDTFELDDYDEDAYVEQILDVIERVNHFFKYQYSKKKENIEKIVLYTEFDFKKNLVELIRDKIDVDIEFIRINDFKTKLPRAMLRKYYLPIAMSL
ncbi:type IV pilus biogenesis protein PilM [Haloplasma contractile]|uniref:Type IV pilus assembly protein PilM n=1 Tax=Haloplasma contractile SSD-17B TaxID=1033810 RepID=U2EFU7_9MOLU|nr:pilus assembly protein PilM [Haloplasma contractile]ERJ13798.1 hypothetical protein HLPCO_000464 [Haloplasma contractile SSD-17B]